MLKRSVILISVVAVLFSVALIGCGKKAKQQAEDATRAQEQAQAKVMELEQALKTAESVAKSAEMDLQQAQSNLNKTEEQLSKTKSMVDEIESEKDGLQAQIDKMKESSQAEKSKMLSKMDELSAMLNETKMQLDAAQKARESLQSEISNLTQQHNQAKSSVQNLKQQNNELQQQIEMLKQQTKEPTGMKEGDDERSRRRAERRKRRKERMAMDETKSQPKKYDAGELELEETGGSPFEIGVTLDYYTHYIWRGQNLMESSFQPGFTFSYKGLTAGIWGQVDLHNEKNRSMQFTELDYSLDYTFAVPQMEWMNASVGVIYYNFATQGGAKDTTEIYWGLSFPDTPLSPYFTVYHDVDEAEGTYVDVGVSHSWGTIFELAEDMPVGLDMAASIGWGNSGYNQYYWITPSGAGVSDSAFNDFNLSISMPTEFMGWDVTPSFNWTMVVDNKLRDTNTSAYSQGYDDSNNYFYFGLSVAKTF